MERHMTPTSSAMQEASGELMKLEEDVLKLKKRRSTAKSAAKASELDRKLSTLLIATNRTRRLMERRTQAYVFALLILSGLGLVVAVSSFHLRWVIPVCLYGLLVQFSLKQFFSIE